MKTEREIRDRLVFWQGMLIANQIGMVANHAEILASLPDALQHFALGQLKYPPELRQHVGRLQEKALGVIIDTLKWVLEEDRLPNGSST